MQYFTLVLGENPEPKSSTTLTSADLHQSIARGVLPSMMIKGTACKSDVWLGCSQKTTSAFIYSKAANRAFLIYSATKRLRVVLLFYEKSQRVFEVDYTLWACLSDTHPSLYVIFAPLKISRRCWKAERILSYASAWLAAREGIVVSKTTCTGNRNVDVVADAKLQLLYLHFIFTFPDYYRTLQYSQQFWSWVEEIFNPHAQR